MKGRNKARVLLLVGLLLVPGMQGCSKGTIDFMKKLQPYVGQVLDKLGDGGKGGAKDTAKAPKAPGGEAPKEPKAAKGDGKVADLSSAKPQKDAQKKEEL